MPTISKLTKLFSAIAEKNPPKILAMADEVIQDEERKGHHRSAQHLKGALLPNGQKTSAFQDASFEGFFLGGRPRPLVPAIESPLTLKDIVLGKKNSELLYQVMKEWRYRAALAEAKIPRRAKLFFHGPPGCGKSVSARALGNELSLPTFIVRFDAVIGAYLGQTAIRLRELFHYAEATPCILLIDEVDALGKRRGSLSDVGELDRIVISLMQELEHSSPQGFVIAASNLPARMDDALWRRFDAVLHFPRPSRGQLISLGAKLAQDHGLSLTAPLKGLVEKASTFAEAERIIEAEARKQAVKRFEADHAKERYKR
jgi:SpoVK/Ycf46/Vps4 family AAA+-type ATPase